MSKINSVLGPLDASNLGYTLMHEHIMTAPIGVYQNYPELLGRGFVEQIVKGLIEAKENGIDTIVDATTFDLGREAALLAEVSRKSGVNIIACTGWCLSDPRSIFDDWSADQYAQLFIREIKEGIGTTGIKAGILKSASDREGVTQTGEVVLRAVARAHLFTSAPIMLHSYAPEEVGREQIAILKEEGVNLNRVKVDHSLETTDTEYLTWLLEEGCYLGMERLPSKVGSDQSKARTVQNLVDRGWAHRLLFSHDAGLAFYAPGMPLKIRKIMERSSIHRFLYAKRIFFPLLNEIGISEATLNLFCIENPRNFFNAC